MKRIFGALMAAVVATTAFAPVASARDYHRGGHYYSYGHRGHGNAAAAGVFGLVLGTALGAAVASDHHRYYDRGYRGGYYGGGYRDRYDDDGYYDGYGRGPSLCIVREHRYDRWGRDVIIEDRRPC